MEIPKTLFKYQSFTTQSLLNLKNASVYFGSPLNFNDPFEFAAIAPIAAPTKDAAERIRQHYLSNPDPDNPAMKAFGEMPFDQLKKVLYNGANVALETARAHFRKDRGVSCFSENCDDLLMWAHYGDKYKGFCLEFRTDIELFKKVHKVDYVNEMPKWDIEEVLVDENFEFFTPLIARNPRRGPMSKSGEFYTTKSIRFSAMEKTL